MLKDFRPQIFTGRTAAETNEKCSLFDPYIGADAGYVQVSHVSENLLSATD